MAKKKVEITRRADGVALIQVTEQDQFDSLPDRFEEFTVIELRGRFVIKRALGNATVRALGNATVRALGNATVEAWGNATVEALGNATVEAWGNATVRALGNATVEALGNATVEAWGNATVEAWGNATVRAWGNATVRALGNATVRAWGNATVEALGNATVRALGNAIMRIIADGVMVKKLSGQAICICQSCKPKITKSAVASSAQILNTEFVPYDQESFIEIYELNPKRGKVILFKSVRDDFIDDYTQSIKYEGVVECSDWDPNHERECGGGLHLSPTPQDALRFHNGKLLQCEVALKDFVVYPHNIQKVRCKKVKVIGECDRKGKLLESLQVALA